MKASAGIVKQLKLMECPSGSARQLRAMFVAQAAALHTPLNVEIHPVTEHSAPPVCPHEKDMLKLVNEINEYIPLDVKLVRSIYACMMATRRQLLTGLTDPALLRMVLSSSAVSLNLSEDMSGVTDAFLLHPQYKAAQAAVTGLMAGDATDVTEDL